LWSAQREYFGFFCGKARASNLQNNPRATTINLQASSSSLFLHNVIVAKEGVFVWGANSLCQLVLGSAALPVDVHIP
jgi:hypothetical protein